MVTAGTGHCVDGAVHQDAWRRVFSGSQTLSRVTQLNRGQRDRRFPRGLLADWQTYVVGIRSSGALCIFVVAMDRRSPAN